MKWAPVAGYEGLYEVSDAGNVRSLPRTKVHGTSGVRQSGGNVLKPAFMGGYAVVSLCDGVDRTRTAKVHLLVIEAFKGPRPAGLVARHLDGVKTNNSATNLEWGTPKENSADAIKHGALARGPRNKNSKLTWEKAAEIRSSPASLTSLAKKFGVSIPSIAAVRRGETWRAEFAPPTST